ncbi:hypothetical protein R3W88_010661 [Solanum pinnatisectum]|uniref:F-box/LRR-repeat protein 15/At3g58940/PEG3-like LRR domain-containing protein n=1 Tax=Solanum pinnatisectum TaxID=50273 RepID=A0AAV9L4M6_9SOLN|nr:hypothetical protein R3W88_010661 [Solanum pinnatisectum]
MSPDSKRAVFEDDRGDRISSLPSNVIDCILEFLPRYIWAMLPNLKLDNLFCNKLASRSQYVFEQTIDKILLQHIGDVVKFDLDLSGVELTPCPDIDRWILYATRNGVKKLKLKITKDGTYKVPSYIFNCPTLTKLKLFNCIIKLPNSFLGFQSLTTLHLERITFEPATYYLRINVPLLVNLTLIHCDGTKYLNIVFSSSLKFLCLHESHYNLDLISNSFKKCKNLTYLYLATDNPIPVERLILEKFLFSSPTLETLNILFSCDPYLCINFCLKLLSAGAVPKKLPFTLNRLWHLRLGVNFNQLSQTSYALELIKSSPNLSKLEISGNASGDSDEAVMKYLDAPSCLDQTLNKLEDVSIHFFRRSTAELSFVKLLFAHAPSLSRMSIKPINSSSSKEELSVATELMRFPRVSPKAKLYYHPTVGLKAE